MHYDKPKKKPITIEAVENGYLVTIGEKFLRYDQEIYIAKDTELSAICIKAVEVAKTQYDAEIAKWKEKEDKTESGYEWQKKKESAKKE